MAVWAEKPCSCGRAWPLVEGVLGRTKDFFVLDDGTRIRVPDSLLHFKEWISRFQLIQEDFYLVRLLIVSNLDANSLRERIRSERPELEQTLRRFMGKECRLQIEIVDDIPTSPSGKYRYVVSKVAEKERRG
jgi:phenylacetate-CoA ligase